MIDQGSEKAWHPIPSVAVSFLQSYLTRAAETHPKEPKTRLPLATRCLAETTLVPHTAALVRDLLGCNHHEDAPDRSHPPVSKAQQDLYRMLDVSWPQGKM